MRRLPSTLLLALACSRSHAPRSAPPPAASALAGQVVGPAGPVAGARVACAAGVPGATDACGVAVTAADGRFTFRVPRGASVHLAIDAAGFARMRAAVTGEVARIALRPEAPIGGTVVDPGGHAIAGAVVRAERGGDVIETRAGGDGSFALHGLGAGPVALTARHAGFAEAHLDTVAPGDARLRMAPLFPLRVRVLSGERPRDAGVTIASSEGPGAPVRVQRARAGADGVLALELPEGIYDLRAEAGGLVSPVAAGIELRAGAPVPGEVELVLGPAVRVEGRVTGPRGAVAGADVRLIDASLALLLPRARTGADGVYRLDGVAPGDYWIACAAAGFLPTAGEPLAVAAPGPVARDLRVTRGATVAGRVVDAAGKGIAGASVEVRPFIPDASASDPIRPRSRQRLRAHARSGAGSGPPVDLPPDRRAADLGVTRGPLPLAWEAASRPASALSPSPAATTDEHGAFEVSGLGAGVAIVVASHPEFAPGSSNPIGLAADARTDVTVSLRRGGAVSGRVRDEDGYPVARARVQLQTVGSSGDAPIASTATDEQGDFSVAGVLGDVRLTIEADGFLPAARALRVGEQERKERVDVDLVPAHHEIAGRVVDDAGQPVADAVVRIAGRAELRTDAAGAFHAAGFGPDAIDAEVRHPDFVSERVRLTPRLGAPEEEPAVALRHGGRVAGFVRDAQTREALAAFEVASGEARARGRRGDFSLGPLAPGPHTLIVTAPDHEPARVAVTVPDGTVPGETTVKDLVIDLAYVAQGQR